MLDGVRVVWASLLEEPLEVVCGQPCLVLVAAYGRHDNHHAEAAHLLAVAIIVVGRNCDCLKMLLARLFATLHGVVDGDVG
jgi:hypothetical protein